MKKSVVMKRYPKGQAARLHFCVVQCNIAVLIGVMILGCVYFTNHCFAKTAKIEVDCTTLLSQYQYSSKMLTSTARAYVIRNDDYYLQMYYAEWDKNKERDDFFEKLKNSYLSDEELAILSEIQVKSDQLTALEKTVIELAQEGKQEEAEQIVFSKEYEKAVESISTNTYGLIEQIVVRLEHEKSVERRIQIFFETLFMIDFFFIVYRWMKTIKFSYHELLKPIHEVSMQMEELSKGNLHSEWNLQADDTEVGQMVSDINRMKSTLSGMIKEITYALEMAGTGDFRMMLVKDYVGEFGDIKEAFIKIVNEIRNTWMTIQCVANEVNNGANQLAVAADGLAEACTIQAAQVSDIMILIDELRETISRDERQAEEAVKISKASESTLYENQNQMNNLKQTIHEIDGLVPIEHHVSQHSSDIEEGTALEVIKSVSNLAEESSNNLEEVIIGTTETSERIENIVQRLKDEIANIDALNENITMVAGIVDDNSAKAEEVAAISVEQKEQVEMLIQLLERYHV